MKIAVKKTVMKAKPSKTSAMKTAMKVQKNKTRATTKVDSGDSDDSNTTTTTVATAKSVSTIGRHHRMEGLSSVVPKAILESRGDEGHGEWKHPQIQAFNTWRRSLAKSGFDTLSDAMAKCKNEEDRIAFTDKLMVCKTDAELRVEERSYRESIGRARTTTGAMTYYEVWDLMKIPVRDDNVAPC